MANIRLTKNELKKQKDSLKRFERYLPTLMLKKQQLQMVIRRVEEEIRGKQAALDTLQSDRKRWVGLFAEDPGIAELVTVTEVRRSRGNIAGVDIPVFEGIDVEVGDYDLFETPLWVDKGIESIKQQLALDAEILVLREQQERLEEELRITTQRVNLFEKVKIPETKENIRVIQIYLGDQQTAAVVRGKIAKGKVVSAA